MTRSLSVSLIRPLQQQQLPGKTSHPQSNNTSIDPLPGRLAFILAESENPEAVTFCHGDRSACGAGRDMRACTDNPLDGESLAGTI